MNEQINEMVEAIMPMMVMVMTMGMVRPVMLQVSERGRGKQKSIVERAASHFNVPVSEVKPWMIEEVEKIERGTGLERGTARGMKSEGRIRQKIRELEEVKRRALPMTTEMDEATFWIDALKWVLGEN